MALQKKRKYIHAFVKYAHYLSNIDKKLSSVGIQGFIESILGMNFGRKRPESRNPGIDNRQIFPAISSKTDSHLSQRSIQIFKRLRLRLQAESITCPQKRKQQTSTKKTSNQKHQNIIFPNIESNIQQNQVYIYSIQYILSTILQSIINFCIYYPLLIFLLPKNIAIAH